MSCMLHSDKKSHCDKTDSSVNKKCSFLKLVLVENITNFGKITASPKIHIIFGVAVNLLKLFKNSSVSKILAK